MEANKFMWFELPSLKISDVNFTFNKFRKKYFLGGAFWIYIEKSSIHTLVLDIYVGTNLNYIFTRLEFFYSKETNWN